MIANSHELETILNAMSAVEKVKLLLTLSAQTGQQKQKDAGNVDAFSHTQTPKGTMAIGETVIADANNLMAVAAGTYRRRLRLIKTMKTKIIDDLLTVSDAARIAGVGVRLIRTRCADHTLPARKLGREWLIEKAALKAFMDRDRKPGPKGPRKSLSQ